jgi:hypothetical protein
MRATFSVSLSKMTIANRMLKGTIGFHSSTEAGLIKKYRLNTVPINHSLAGMNSASSLFSDCRQKILNETDLTETFSWSYLLIFFRKLS